MITSKEVALSALVQKRRMEVLPGYRCLSSFHEGRYECEYVVPWTKSACNLNAEVFILAQDWASEEFLNKPFKPRMAEVGQHEVLPTNKNLKRLLEDHLCMEFGETYATDLLPSIKPGRMDERLLRPDLKHCAKEYALEQIRIVEPLMVICLGRTTTFRAICDALALTPPLCGKNDPLGPFHWSGAEVYGVTHPGAWGAVHRRRWAKEWQFLACRLTELRAASRETSSF